MEVKHYRCDICGKTGPWAPGWISVTLVISRRLFWEHEFHVCSKACDDKLDHMPKAERKKLAWESGKTTA